MPGFMKLTLLEEALERVKAAVKPAPLEVVDISLEESLGMVLAKDVIAPVDMPPFDRGVVDGYAVLAEDTAGASPLNPIKLKVIGKVEVGADPSELPQVLSGEALEISTGAPMPKGANAVVMKEYCRLEGSTLWVLKAVAGMQNVSKRGEDFKEGDVVVRAGTRVRPWHIAAMASLNITSVPVYRRLRVAILSTGAELKELGASLKPGEIINSSRPMLKALIAEAGCEPIDLGLVEDDVKAIASKVSQGLAVADIVIVTGGTSLGEKDLVPEAVNSLGRPGVIAHGLRIRPGKPTAVGVIDGKPIFMLSGFPVAALVGFEAMVKLVMTWLMRTHPEPYRIVKGRLTRRVTNVAGTRSYLRVRASRQDGGFIVEPLMLTGSGLLSTLTKANALLIIPEDVEGFDEGDEVEVALIQPLEAAT